MKKKFLSLSHCQELNFFMSEKDQLASRVLGIASIVGATALAWTVSRKSKSNFHDLHL
jgi:hypothetical protein